MAIVRMLLQYTGLFQTTYSGVAMGADRPGLQSRGGGKNGGDMGDIRHLTTFGSG